MGKRDRRIFSGSSFGAVQGSGQVWLGTLNGVVQSWSDTQIVALVAAGAASGNVQVLQNGVMSTGFAFTVNTLQLTSVSPASGSPGTSVTFTGAGFGALQGSGTVWLGSSAGQVLSWSDTQVVAAVAPGALTGIARVQQNGAWSKSFGFIVPVAGGNTVMPAMLNMVVGDTHTIQALSPAGPVTGLAWKSSDTTLVSLSTDDPPLLTALAAGHVTITAGTASADVTVWDPATLPGGTLPLGTVIWSNPGDGSGVQYIVPAVPSPSGVADVFAFQSDGTVQAMTSDGTTAWTADVSQATGGGPPDSWPGSVLPDFQGGLVILQNNNGQGSIYKLDGITGQPYPAYTPAPNPDGTSPSLGQVAVHTDGTVFAIQSTGTCCNVSGSLIGINPTTGTQKFSVPLPPIDDSVSIPVDSLIIAGDGYAYLARSYWRLDYCSPCDSPFLWRVDTSGNSVAITIPGDVDPGGGLITNADQGVVLTWGGFTDDWSSFVSKMLVTTGTSVSTMSGPALAGQNGIVVPVLQAQDGSFVGTGTTGSCCEGDSTTYMVSFDATGNVRWVVPNEQPQIATADGGVIGQSGITYDQNGNATGQMGSLPTQSWRGNTYQDGSVEQLMFNAIVKALTLWAQAGANPSGNSTAGRPWYFKLVWQNAFSLHPDNPQYLPNLAIDATSQAATIKSAALTAFKKAFYKFPVNADEGAANTGDNRGNIVNGYNYNQNGQSCGLSSGSPGSHDSNVYYLANMEQSQWALPILLNTLQDVQNALGRVDLMKAIGTGIGNNAAHEIGHQFFLTGFGMDDSSTNTYNGQGCDGARARWVYGFGPISWESVTANAWKNTLGTGWHK